MGPMHPLDRPDLDFRRAAEKIATLALAVESSRDMNASEKMSCAREYVAEANAIVNIMSAVIEEISSTERTREIGRALEDSRSALNSARGAIDQTIDLFQQIERGTE